MQLPNGKLHDFEVGFEQAQVGARDARQNAVWRHVAVLAPAA